MSIQEFEHYTSNYYYTINHLDSGVILIFKFKKQIYYFQPREDATTDNINPIIEFNYLFVEHVRKGFL